MILLMGVVLAVMFVALALLVNAAIYTDNVATRGGDPAAEALEYQNGVVDSTAGLLVEENDGGTTADEVEPAIGSISEYHRTYHLRRGMAAETSVDTVNEGLFINETDVTGFENWEVNAASAREFDMTLDTTEMSEGNETSFYIDLGTEQLEVNKTSGDLVVEGGSENVECTVEANGDVDFNVSAELLGGDPCEFGWSAFGGGDLGIRSGENGAGTYALTVDTDDSVGEPPDSKTVVYDVDLVLHVTTPELRYERTVRVVPEGVDA
jgi:hypothetical protein